MNNFQEVMFYILILSVIRYTRAIQYYNKAVKIVDPLTQVDNVLLPFTDMEARKLERLGKIQKKKYLVNREKKRQELLAQEEIHQEKRLQDCYMRLFRVHLILAVQEMSPPEEQTLHDSTFTGLPEAKKSTSKSLVSTTNTKVLSGGGDKQLVEEHLLKSHISLRAAFRAFHPERMEAYINVLQYAHSVLMKLLVRHHISS